MPNIAAWFEGDTVNVAVAPSSLLYWNPLGATWARLRVTWVSDDVKNNFHINVFTFKESIESEDSNDNY